MYGIRIRRPRREHVGVGSDPESDEGPENDQKSPASPEDRDLVGEPLSEGPLPGSFDVDVPRDQLVILEALHDLVLERGQLSPLGLEDLVDVLAPELVEVRPADPAFLTPVRVRFGDHARDGRPHGRRPHEVLPLKRLSADRAGPLVVGLLIHVEASEASTSLTVSPERSRP